MKNRLLNLVIYWPSFIFKQGHIFLSRPYYLIRTSWLVWFFILNKRTRHLYNKSQPQLNRVQQRVNQDLKEHGIAITHVDELFPEKKLLPGLQKYTWVLLGKAEIKTGKKFLLNLWDHQPVIDFNNLFIRLVLDQKILDIVNTYLEMFSRFYHFTLNVTLPVGPGSQAVQSQRWHRDPEDKKMCKVFIYLNDVDEENGPFMYVLKSHHGGRWRKLFPQRPPKGVYPPLGAVERVVPKKDIKVCVAKAGTIIFCDTSGLHKGGYAISKKRLMFTGSYSSKASLWPRQYRYPDNFNTQLDQLDVPARYALTE